MDLRQHNNSQFAIWKAVLKRQEAYEKIDCLYLQRCVTCLVFGLTLVAGWLEHQFSPLAAMFGVYLIIYPYASKAAIDLTRKYLKHSLPARLLMPVDAIQLGLAIGLSGFALVPALASTSLLLLYVLLRKAVWYALLSAVLLAAGSYMGLLLNIPVNLGTPPFATLLCMPGLAIQFGFAVSLLYRQHLTLKSLRRDMQAARSRHESLARDLTRYLPPQVWQQVFRHHNTACGPLKTQRKKLTVFFSDIKGFTELSEEMEPEDLTDILNGYLSDMTTIALKHGGTIDKFIGDCIMVFFGDSQSRGARHDAIAAVSMAIEMRKHMRTLRQRWQAKGIHKRLEIRMGINTGYCTVGTFGAESRMDYTVIGREVNLASRLENAASADEILITGETYTLIKDKIMGRDKGQIQVKGFARPVSIYQVVDYRRDLGPARSYLAHELPGFSMQLDTATLELKNIEQVVKALSEALEHLQD